MDHLPKSRKKKAMPIRKPTPKPTCMSELYRSINRHRSLAGGTPDSPIYGENSKGSLTRAFVAMGLGEAGSVFCDVGSGAGVPSLQAACEYPGLVSYGFEVMGVRWWISQTILADVLCNKLTSEVGSRVLFAHTDLGDLGDFGPCTHVFAFDTGFPASALEEFARAFNHSQHVRVLACFHKPAELLEAGFEGLEPPIKVPMNMFGSNESKQLLVYSVALRPPSNETSWNLTRLGPIPKDPKFQPSVLHSPSYVCGEEARLQGAEAYSTWVADQIGFNRKASVGVRTRSAAQI